MDEKSLRMALLAAQYELKSRQQRAVIVLVNGVEAAGKGETVKRLSQWMDSRHLRIESFVTPSEQEQNYPPYWRFWQKLPSKGEIALFFGNWYSGLLEARVDKEISRKELNERLQEAQQFERLLANEGIAVVKFWFALSEEQLHLRLAELQKNPVLRWQAQQRVAWHKSKIFQRYTAAAQQLWQNQDVEKSRWHIIDGWDAKERDSCVGKILLATLHDQLAETGNAKTLPLAALKSPKFLNAVDLSPAMKKDDYQEELKLAQAEFSTLFRSKTMDKRALAIVFEGMDAAGKGGAIRRLTAALDPREYHVMQVSAPTPQQRLLPYLARFWQKIPALGQCTIYDRSWYGRVLVERIDGFCSEDDCNRAYGEINQFEEELTKSGVIVVKFWLAIDKEVQLARFTERERVPFKRFKITADDWHNREKWDDYIDKASEAIERTHHKDRPWIIIPANNKYYARVQVMKSLNEILRAL